MPTLTLCTRGSCFVQLDPEGVIAQQDLFSVYVHTMPGFYFKNSESLCNANRKWLQPSPSFSVSPIVELSSD